MVKCRVCGHEWQPRTKEPIACPRCKRYDWKEEVKIKANKGLLLMNKKGLVALGFLLVFFSFFLISSVNVQNSNAVPNIKGNNSIQIVSANLSKTKVVPGDTLTVIVEVRAKAGVKEIVADMGDIENISLQHVAGNIYQGTWQNTWLVHSTEVKNYTVTLFVRDNAGNELIDKSLSFIDQNLNDNYLFYKSEHMFGDREHDKIDWW